MTKQTFIEKIIEGGWAPRNPKIGSIEDAIEHIHEVLLDPKAWKALGKVEGWPKLTDAYIDTISTQQEETVRMLTWQLKMHDMIDALAERKTIGEFLESI